MSVTLRRPPIKKSQRLCWAGRLAGMSEYRTVFDELLGNPIGKRGTG